MLEDLGLSPAPLKSGVVHTHNTSTWDVEVGGSKVQGHALLPTGSYTSLSYTDTKEIIKFPRTPRLCLILLTPPPGLSFPVCKTR